MFHRHFHERQGERRGHEHGHGCDDRRFARGGRGWEGSGFGRGERHHGRGGGLGRFFAHGDLKLVILQLIAEKPRHGYEIIKAIEERVGGAYSPSPGVIYPSLTLLEELGYVTVSAGDGGKKLHAITGQGEAFLAANRPALDALLARMDEAGRAQGGGPAPQILRAMENLKLALRLRLARGPLSEGEANAVAAALDAAATQLERT
jgi:DNA-binding PadR family transcriptional regulator